MAFEALRPMATVATEATLRRSASTAIHRILSAPHRGRLDRGRDWKAFTIRFARSAQGVGLDKTVADGLRAALLEMTDNSVLHAQADSPTLVGYRVLDGFAQFCVADPGSVCSGACGVAPDFAYLPYDHEAIREALRDGVSRYGYRTRRHGLPANLQGALAAQWGQLRFRSGQGCITMDGTDLDADHFDENFVAQLPGFQVTVSCRTDVLAPSAPILINSELRVLDSSGPT